MQTKKPLCDIDRVFIYAVMFEMGILPMEDPGLDMRRALAQLPPEEARALKRKFRKVWRKAMRQEIGTGKKTREVRELEAQKRYAVGQRTPTRVARNARKELVFKTLWKESIEPLLKKVYDVDAQKQATQEVVKEEVTVKDP